ncbi:glycerol-3-phosphate 1-O-acyltransferase PlsB [Alcanivorax sp. 1008]|uniref:glycerol-3-phosphate 1-O-acyltransferase PlsB n=1 Tax=Alcanivorax sp. 1008 TaxID=2816853 RepID=UPI001D418BD0|nr:glycerol-3-phosphate 1-O-acyltransferase PlsB [Alcanivorax sp. 1008]MCC1495634.1 glycerol-3-phosphate 1-O-acyltransferase PlsB [Alcanivorax sp. 1008]
MSPWLGLDKLVFAFARLILNLYTRATEQLDDLDALGVYPDTPVVYVLRDAAMSDILVVERETKRMKLPSPLASVDFADQHLRRRSFAIYRRPIFGRDRVSASPQRMEHLISALRKDATLDVQLVPVSVFWGRRPEKENSLWKIIFSDNWSAPGFLKKIVIVLTQGRQLLVHFSQPMSLRQLVEESDDDQRVSRKAQRILRVHFRRQQEAIIGPDLSHRRTLVNTLVESAQVRAAIELTAKEENTSEAKLVARARSYAREIAADYSYTVIRFLEVLLNWVWNQLYDGIRLYNIDKLRQVAREHEVIYVPCHRSHIDYLLLSFVVHRNNLVPPHIAAGINLNMPVVGSILRRAGAFFMRRTFKGNPLYSAVFNEYLHTMVTRGFSIEYFVEGGRSRSGRMLQPKTGMLAMTVRSFLRDANKPVAFVPVYIGYEKVIEARSYIGEMHGAKKKKESLFGLISSSLSLLRSHFGEVHVNFGEPLILSDFLDQSAPDWRTQKSIGDSSPEWFKQSISQLGDAVVTGINSAAVANPVNLLSLAVLATPKHTMDEEQLRRQLALYLTLLSDARFSPNTAIAEHDPQAIIDYGIEHEFLRRIEHPLGSLVSTDPVTALQMTYVRNNSLHLFILPGMISALFDNARRIELGQLYRLVNLLYPFFRTEYFLPWQSGEQLDAMTDSTIAVLEQQGLISREGDFLKGAPQHSMEADLLDHLGQTVQQALERFSLTIRVLVQHGSGVLDNERLEELAYQTAQRLSLLHEFNSPEFFDRNVLRNFINQLRLHGLVRSNDAGMLEFDDRLQALDDEASRILSVEINHTILRITRLSIPAS